MANTATQLQATHNAQSVVVSGLNNTTNPVTFSVTTGHGARFPATTNGPFSLLVEAELLLVTTRTAGSDSLTATRGDGGTTNTAHADGTTIEHVHSSTAQQRLADFARLHTHTGGADGVGVAQVLAQAGDATNPSVAFVDQPHWGWYWDAGSNRAVFVRGSQQALAIAQNGAVVIGDNTYAGSPNVYKFIITEGYPTPTTRAGNLFYLDLQSGSAGGDNAGMTCWVNAASGNNSQLRVMEARTMRLTGATENATRVIETDAISQVAITDYRNLMGLHVSNHQGGFTGCVTDSGVGIMIDGDRGWLYMIVGCKRGAESGFGAHKFIDLEYAVDNVGGTHTTTGFYWWTNPQDFTAPVDDWRIIDTAGVLYWQDARANVTYQQLVAGASGYVSFAPPKGVRVGSALGAPATSALLDLQSTTGALALPSMTATNRAALTGVDRMMVYDNTLGAVVAHQAGIWWPLGGLIQLLNAAETTDVNAGTAMPTPNASVAAGTTRSFTIHNANSLILVSISGLVVALPTSANAQTWSQIVIDGATAYKLGGEYCAAGVGGNCLSGGTLTPITNPGVGSHTIQLQAILTQVGTLYLRALTGPEHMAIRVYESAPQ